MTVAMLNVDPDVPNDLHVCSRNLSLKESDTNSLWMLVRKHDLEAKMIAHGLTNVAIQGEIVGPGIGGNHYKLKEPKFFVFRMYDISKGEFLEPSERREWCSKLDLPQVPLVAASVDLEDTLGITTVDHVIKFADGKSQLNPGVLREGLVFKEIGGQWHWKVVSNEYLLTT
jgi:RNA ligase (TIGR02306 family)